jgi:hypothetical protein
MGVVRLYLQCEKGGLRERTGEASRECDSGALVRPHGT